MFLLHHLLTQEVPTLTNWANHRLKPIRFVTFLHRDNKVFRRVEGRSDQIRHGCVNNNVVFASIAFPANKKYKII